MAPQVTERPGRSLLPTMILYLLFPALIFGFVESQTANMTVEELNKVEGNQTFRELITNSTMQAGNVTSSLYIDEKRVIEDELQNNQTSVIREDSENFQDQETEFPGRYCHEEELEVYSHSLCGDNFRMEMTSISPEKWCVLENIIRPYNTMTVCLELVSETFGCYYPNSIIQALFISIHSTYFYNCSSGTEIQQQPPSEDAPQAVVIALTLIPVSLIPVLVYLVVWRSESGSIPPQ
ncbi:uncharacterized protein LOC131959128 [Centropristis striata]|uniref:uncharacterized protein LOC131959128 n=1 Tax=Centropristis striata TaxID=184440 RepID=UPI0027E10C45|nr:uncharacterized protein LOC131959128 [Centropristis striata]